MVTKLKPFNPGAGEIEADWHVLDAQDQVLGRIASRAAMLLMGKHRPTYVPHLLSGDFVVIINAASVRVTGLKAEQIVYKRHSQKPGKLKEIPYRKVQEKFPERIIEHAVRGMLPKNKLGERMIRRLKVYADAEHPHASQVAWTARRPERDAAAAEQAEESARKRREARERAVAKKQIAEDAAARVDAAESKPAEEKEPMVARANTVKSETAEATTEEKPKPRRRAAAKKTDTVKSEADAAVAEPAPAEEPAETAETPKKPRTRGARKTTAAEAKSTATKAKPRAGGTKRTRKTASADDDPGEKTAKASEKKPRTRASTRSTRSKTSGSAAGSPETAGKPKSDE